MIEVSCDFENVLDIMYLICHVTLQNQTTTWLYGRKFFILSSHPLKFGGHYHCNRGYVIVSDCLVVLQDHVIKGPGDFIGGSP